jgi:hypothetical protein
MAVTHGKRQATLTWEQARRNPAQNDLLRSRSRVRRIGTTAHGNPESANGPERLQRALLVPPDQKVGVRVPPNASAGPPGGNLPGPDAGHPLHSAAPGEHDPEINGMIVGI